MSAAAEEKNMTKKELKARKVQRLRDKVKIRLNMIQQEFVELQKELEYNARELVQRPLIDGETGEVYDLEEYNS